MQNLPREIYNVIGEYLPRNSAAQLARASRQCQLIPTYEQYCTEVTYLDVARLIFNEGEFMELGEVILTKTITGKFALYRYFNRELVIITSPEELAIVLSQDRSLVDRIISKTALLFLIPLFRKRIGAERHLKRYYLEVLRRWTDEAYGISMDEVWSSRVLTPRGIKHIRKRFREWIPHEWPDALEGLDKAERTAKLLRYISEFCYGNDNLARLIINGLEPGDIRDDL